MEAKAWFLPVALPGVDGLDAPGRIHQEAGGLKDVGSRQRENGLVDGVVEPEIVSELEKLLEDEQPNLPASPHDLSDSGVFRVLPEGGSPQ